MKNRQQKLPTVRLRNSYVTTVVSIAMVLFLLSLLGLLLLNTRRISDFVKENIGFSVILKDDVREADRVQLQKYFDASPAIKSTTFVSAEQAAEELQKELGENFIEFLGVNPLKASIDIKFHAAYANPDSLARLEKEYTAYPQVEEVYYQESMVHLVNENLRKISIVILAFSALLLLISIALFNNTIRLLVYSKRFIIKTMQLVGANRKYILRPLYSERHTERLVRIIAGHSPVPGRDLPGQAADAGSPAIHRFIHHCHAAAADPCGRTGTGGDHNHSGGK